MLPQTLFDRMISMAGLRFGPAKLERRLTWRVPFRCSAIAYPLIGTRLGDPMRVMIRDISRNGVGVLMPSKDRISEEWVIGLGERSYTSETTTVLTCKTRRFAPAGSLSRILGSEFLAVLGPGQELRAGDRVEQYVWVPCLRETPEDPLEATTSFSN
jgi:hypothetical protein